MVRACYLPVYSQMAGPHVVFNEGRKEVFYLMKHSTHFIYGYMASEYDVPTSLQLNIHKQ